MTSYTEQSITTVDLATLRRVIRGQIIAIALIGLVLGLIGLIFPGATLLTVAIVFGSFLIASGVFRLIAAFIAHTMVPAVRWLSAIMGVLLLVVGVLALANPFGTIEALGLIIGIGWIFDGVVDFVLGLRGAVQPRWFGFVSGIVSIAAGVAMFVLPFAGVNILVQIGSILLIVVALTTLLTLPGKKAEERATAGR